MEFCYSKKRDEARVEVRSREIRIASLAFRVHFALRLDGIPVGHWTVYRLIFLYH
jgi:hypothetical protein